MTRRAGTPLRWLRASVVGLVSLASGAVAHASAGGLMPGPVALAVILAVTTAAAAGLLGRPASTVRVVLLLMAGQTFVHGALTALRGHRGDPPLVTSTTHVVTTTHVAGPRRGSFYDVAYAPGHGGSGQLVLPAPVQHLLADLTGPHAVMALAHLAAAAVVGLWLAVGERALWSVMALLASATASVIRALTTPLSVRVPARPAPRPTARQVRTAPRIRRLRRVVVRRGPPLLLAC